MTNSERINEAAGFFRGVAPLQKAYAEGYAAALAAAEEAVLAIPEDRVLVPGIVRLAAVHRAIASLRKPVTP